MSPSVDKMLEELTELTTKAMLFGIALKNVEHYQLKYRPEPKVWNIYECLEHLNLYGDHYLPEIEKGMNNSRSCVSNGNFKGSILGKYFVKIIRPVEGNIKKMKTAKTMNPIGADLGLETLDRFIDQQQKLMDLLERSRFYDLKRIKIRTTLSRSISLNLGDTLRFVVYHNERHLIQAGELLRKVEKSVELSVA